MNYHIHIGKKRPIEDGSINGLYYYTNNTIEVFYGSFPNLVRDKEFKDYTIEDILNHEILHHVLHETFNVNVACALDKMCYENARVNYQKIRAGLNLERDISEKKG